MGCACLRPHGERRRPPLGGPGASLLSVSRVQEGSGFLSARLGVWTFRGDKGAQVPALRKRGTVKEGRHHIHTLFQSKAAQGDRGGSEEALGPSRRRKQKGRDVSLVPSGPSAQHPPLTLCTLPSLPHPLQNKTKGTLRS